MKYKIACIILFAVLTISPAFVNAAQQKPLSGSDLLGLLEGGVYSGRIAILVQERGIAFLPTAAYLESLRVAGADESLLHAVTTAHRITSQLNDMPLRTPQVMQNPLPNPAISVSHGTLHVRQRVPRSANLGELFPLQSGALAGAKITMQNWRKYQRYMPLGMIELFEGKHFWKMPPDIEIVVGPTIAEKLPRGYLEATEKYSPDVRVVHLPGGRNDIENYVAGEPFPKPQQPDKGYKLLADLWFAYTPHLIAGTPQNPLKICSQSRHGYISCVQLSYVYRQTAYNTDAGVRDDNIGDGKGWYTEWTSIEEPEELKYTTRLVLFFKDNQRPQEVFTFIPSLRRSFRGSLASRCGNVTGTDFAQDDYKRVGFNGGIGVFGAEFLGHQQILALTGDYTAAAGDFPANYYMPLGWPKPSWGNWQLRDVDVIDVRRVPTQRSGYCYAKRIIYEDSENHYALWEDAYDSNMHLWKIALVAQRMVRTTSLGYVPGALTVSAWDIKYNHMTNASTQDKQGHDILVNYDVPGEYRNFTRYSTPAGLAEIMK
jgi:hypothetical protein